MLGNSTETFLPKLIDVGVDFAKASLGIVLIIVAAYIGLRLLRLALNRLETLLIRAATAAEVIPGAATKRIRTLMSVLWTIVVGLVWFVAVLTTLGQIGVNVTPVLAGAGIVGLAIGFGAQNLVKDLVSGFFLILENQVRVGDVALSTAPEDWWKPSHFAPSYCVMKPRSSTSSLTEALQRYRT